MQISDRVGDRGAIEPPGQRCLVQPGEERRRHCTAIRVVRSAVEARPLGPSDPASIYVPVLCTGTSFSFAEKRRSFSDQLLGGREEAGLL